MRMSSWSSVGVLAPRVPARVPALDDAEAKALRMYLLSHAQASTSLRRSSTTIGDVARALEDARGAPVRARQEALLRRPLVDPRRLHVERVDVDVVRRTRRWRSPTCSVFATSCARALRLNSRMPIASSTGLPRIRSTTRRAFWGAMRACRVLARASITMPFAYLPAGLAPGFTSALRAPECPWNVRVGENSPEDDESSSGRPRIA